MPFFSSWYLLFTRTHAYDHAMKTILLSHHAVVKLFSFTELEKRYFMKLTPVVVNRLKINSYYALFTNAWHYNSVVIPCVINYSEHIIRLTM